MHGIPARQIIFNGLYDELDQLGVPGDQHGDEQVALKQDIMILVGFDRLETYNLFFCVLIRGEEVDSLDLPEVNVMAEEENEKKLANIFLLLVSI